MSARSVRCGCAQPTDKLGARRECRLLRRALAAVIPVLVLLGCVFSRNCAFAAGNQTQLNGEDLVVTVDWRWAGCANGGYYPVRVRIVNRGESRTLTAQISSPGQHSLVPRVQRTIAVDQNATVHFTLSVPMVGSGTYALLRVFHKGQYLDKLGSCNINLPDVNWGAMPRPALLVVAPTVPDCSAFESAVTSTVFGGSTGGSSSPYYGGRITSDHEVVPPVLLPDSWIDYSGLDLLAVSLATFEKLPEPNRSAILKWVQQGGTAIVFDVGEPARDSERLRRLLDLDKLSASNANWQDARLGDRRMIAIVQTDDNGNVVRGPQAVAESPASASAPGKSSRTQSGFVWPGTSEAFSRHDCMLGAIYAFPNNPFPGSAHDWAWLLRSVGRNHYQWPLRHGLSSRQECGDEFLQFLIPGIKSVPAYSFLVLITIFSIVIGPLNYFFLLRRKKLYLLVLTIPIIAIVTSASLFAYSIVAHGFAIKSRVRSLTRVDQTSKTAVTTARVALYAGLAPSRGLQFSPDTAVYPIWAKDQEFKYGSVDWTQTQALTSGWLRSRTRTQFLTVTHRAERGRLDIQPAVNGQLPVSNGFEWGFQALVLADEKGALYFGSQIPAGASVRLIEATEEKQNAMLALLERYPMAAPPGVSGTNSFDFFNMRRSYRYYSRYAAGRASYQAANSIMEQSIRQFSKTRTLEPRSYIAVLDQTPDVEMGVSDTTEINHLHILIGYY